MNRSPSIRHASLAFSLIACTAAQAHISYSGRDFGSFSSAGEAPRTISNRVTGTFSWADGTDEDWGSSEPVRAFRFTLTYDAKVTIDVSATTSNGAFLGDLLPGFSIYGGLGHLPPDNLDHDEAPISMEWLLAEGGGTKEGNFRALADWKAGNDPGGPNPPSLSSFSFKGYAVDGTSANFGTAPGVVGDGLADGHVVGTFNLGPGDYTLFIGGANYAGQNQVPADNALRGVNVTLIVPEPAAAGFSLIGIAGLLLRRRR